MAKINSGGLISFLNFNLLVVVFFNLVFFLFHLLFLTKPQFFFPGARNSGGFLFHFFLLAMCLMFSLLSFRGAVGRRFGEVVAGEGW